MGARRALLIVLVLAACGDDDGPAGGDPDGSVRDGRMPMPRMDGAPPPPVPDAGPVVADPTAFSYRLTESSADLVLWTRPATHKVPAEERAPEATQSGLRLSAARNEHEPVQLLLGPGSGSLTASIAPFASLSGAQRTEIAVAEREEGWPEHLRPIGPSDGVVLEGGAATVLWLTVYVPEDAPAGDHATTLTLTPSGGAPIAVPVTLHVFDFALPREIHFASQLNLSVADVVGDGTVDSGKTTLYEHRLTPASVAWPSGFNWGITWENDRSSNRCEVLWDEPDEGDAYSIGWLSRRYMLGEGWNGAGFPDSMLFQFVDNSTPRPASFCGIDRGDHFGGDAYNAEWSQFLGALEAYLTDNGLVDRTYWYVQNEPQDDEDHRLAAHLCRLSRSAAPNLRIAVSEEPTPAIAERPEGACGYDIWIAHIQAYQETYAHSRQRDHGESVWLYSLDHDPDPFPNPTRLDRQGLHQRILPWVSWRVRATGWAYYDGGRFFDGPQPTVRAALLREGFEDYEYLWLANGSGHPEVDVDAVPDATVASVASSLTSWTDDPDALMALRFELGRFVEGSRDTVPVLEVDRGGRPRAAYYVNFQDPAGQPTADPLVIDGRTYLKVGWVPWNEELGYGWLGENVGDPAIALYGYDDVAGYDEAARSYVYDDYGRANRFELALENGRYEVTVAVGRPARGYPGDPHNATIEGTVIVDDEPTTDAMPQLVRSAVVDLRDGRLSLEMGGRSETTGDFAYTFLAYLHVVPVD
ncbi:MAG: hypothetical protein IT379_21110 [Deltaproteobacteria bacterium]|nr:hypothetical protein [Deltaproteobacteria bacterium]